MDVESLLRGANVVRRAGPNLPVTGVEYDSRHLGKGALFVAIEGATTDGSRYIPQAVARGASAIVTGSAAAFAAAHSAFPEIAVVEVPAGAPHGRRALAILAANFFQHPAAQLKLTGITGTNGKTTTAFMLDAMLRCQGRKTVLVGTIEYRVAGRIQPAPHTTPESRDLLELFREGVNQHASEGVLEVSSHALDQERVFGLNFDVAVFTNLTGDHLDYHGAMGNYFLAKRKLFDGSSGQAPRAAVLNCDDEYGRRLHAVSANSGSSTIFSYGMHGGDFHAAGLEMTASGMRFAMVTPLGTMRMETRLAGRVNVYNLLAASAAAAARGLSLEQIAAGAASLHSIPGRFENVLPGREFTVIVDYAHTEDALKNAVRAARDFVKPENGRVITLFGCGGDRDRTKRPLMGRAAGVASDIVVLTSDNPRSEDPESILDDVLPGLRGTRATVLIEPDRRRAIQLAIQEARRGDLVLLAGKGHEKTQTLRGQVIPFDDAAVARSILEAMGQAGERANGHVLGQAAARAGEAATAPGKGARQMKLDE